MGVLNEWLMVVVTEPPAPVRGPLTCHPARSRSPSWSAWPTSPMRAAAWASSTRETSSCPAPARVAVTEILTSAWHPTNHSTHTAVISRVHQRRRGHRATP